MKSIYIIYHILMGSLVTYFFTKFVWLILNSVDCAWNYFLLMLLMMSVWLQVVIARERSKVRVKNKEYFK